MARMNVQVTDNQNVTVSVTPVPRTEVTINRGMVGPAGPNSIGGYPISIIGEPANYDALMFNSSQGAWTNIPQTEIADGGNF
jgi:hypothetical protein